MNKYQEALERLYSLKNGVKNKYPFKKFDKDVLKQSQIENTNPDIEKDKELLQELVDMHTQPLKLEELKENMWVWDNKIKKYIKLDKHHNKGLGYLVYDSKIDTLDWFDLQFEEKRFYRYQPL